MEGGHLVSVNGWGENFFVKGLAGYIPFFDTRKNNNRVVSSKKMTNRLEKTKTLFHFFSQWSKSMAGLQWQKDKPHFWVDRWQLRYVLHLKILFGLKNAHFPFLPQTADNQNYVSFVKTFSPTGSSISLTMLAMVKLVLKCKQVVNGMICTASIHSGTSVRKVRFLLHKPHFQKRKSKNQNLCGLILLYPVNFRPWWPNSIHKWWVYTFLQMCFSCVTHKQTQNYLFPH